MLNTVLKITRIVNDMTIKSVSENSGVSYSCISELEAGKKSPTITTLKSICKVYNISLSQLLLFEELSEEKQLNYQEILKMILEYYIYEKNNQNSNTQILAKTK